MFKGILRYIRSFFSKKSHENLITIEYLNIVTAKIELLEYHPPITLDDFLIDRFVNPDDFCQNYNQRKTQLILLLNDDMVFRGSFSKTQLHDKDRIKFVPSRYWGD